MHYKLVFVSVLISITLVNGQGSEDIPIGDTLTVVQRPILNIPEIITPGETMDILCLADESTSNWQAQLLFNEITLDLTLLSTNYDQGTDLWTLTVNVPIPDLYELYDLKVTASNDLMDITRNSVQLIPEERDEYYFVHITDTHLPVKIYWSDDPEAALNDTTTMIALRKIIQDVNLINPEFVLITGDVINEGELEDYGNGRVYTKTKRILGEFEVPVYLIAGNHDLGGWVDTPPTQGTARRNWWRFFGWKSLEFSPTYTQDYTFHYGDITYIGMESYVNYDSFMYDIYGYYSLIPSQLDWLTNQLENIPEDNRRVLFIHHDFSDQISLGGQNIEMMLSGHVHSNWDDFTPPYNIKTRAAYPDGEAYRVIKVNPDGFEPQYASYASYYGSDNLTIAFSPSNNGSSDSVSAVIHNDQYMDFEHAKIKFIMPHDTTPQYTISNGTLLQVDTSGDVNICYVNTVIPENDDVTVTIVVEGSSGSDPSVFVRSFELHPAFPNPFNPATTISFTVPNLITNSDLSLDIYDAAGRQVHTLFYGSAEQGEYTMVWDASQFPSGVYFVQMTADNFHQTEKLLLLK